MRYRKIRDLTVSEIALGCSGFWGNRRFDERKAIKIVREAFDLGINYFDTGHNYCNYNAEPRLGRALSEIVGSTDRSKLVVSTKAGTVRPRPLFSLKDIKTTDHSPEYIERACIQAIKNLGIGYIDVFYLHNFSKESITDELLTRLQRMQREGMFRLLGINTHRESQMRYVADLKNVFDVVLIDLNVAQLDRIPVVEYMHRAGLSVVAGTVLAQGHLIAGKIGHIRKPADLWYLARATLKPDARKLSQAARSVRSALTSIHGMTPAQAAISYVLSLPQVSSCVVGTTDIRNLHEVAASTDKALSSNEAGSILSAYQQQSFRVSV
ncbi:aldo/keto reductase [Bradyrhizobium sp. 83012]|uniref:Aldo/keto reductase n=1 Tax=Bradyrhizobium aeschynomenes TaxID=2734909 RepID=A0ABX2CJM6_9BRAD|nr:aldo/keto reductase [Bradyrhizobium aeschynomenes]NPU67539.1 aldo/keto reductase [Bradyrhizobium aeschynomenes]